MRPQPTIADTGLTDTARPHGLNCPVCQAFIATSMTDLLHKGHLDCPGCGLRLTINRTQSKQALEALAKVEKSIQNLRETETFKG